MDPQAITISHQGQESRLVLEGTLNIALAAELHAAARQAAASGHDVIACCEKVDYLDPSALQILVALRRHLNAVGRNLLVSGLAGRAAETVQLAGMAASLGLPPCP